MATYYLDKDGLAYLWGKIKGTFVAKEQGKGLSTNDYTTAEKTKLGNIEAGAEVNVIETVKVNGTAQTVTSKAVDITVPTKLSDLTNDNNTVTDASYVHTDNNYTTAEKTKLSNIAAGADVNVIETVKVNGSALTPDANKAVDITVPTALSDLNNDGNFVTDADYVHTDNNYTDAEKTKLAGIAEGAEVNVQADWSQTTTTADDYIKNKPTIGTGTLTIQKNGTTVQTFSANNTSNVTADITVPTALSELTNDGDGTAGSTYATTSEVSDAIAAAVGDITSFEYEVVQTLPITGETGVIYLIQQSGASGQNIYNEFIWLGSSYETLGTTAMDLSNYVQFSNIATTGTAGVVKSSSANGDVAVNSSTGVMTVNGFATLKSTVDGFTAITNAEIDAIAV